MGSANLVFLVQAHLKLAIRGLNMRLLQIAGLCALTAVFAQRASATDYTPVYLYHVPASSNMDATHVAVGGVLVGNSATSPMFYTSSGTPVDLTPTNLPYLTPGSIYVDSSDGTHEVGIGGANDGTSHPLLWNTPGSTAVDLMPAIGFTQVEAIAVSGSQQVGQGYGPATAFQSHALMWSGTSASFVDLNPSNFKDSHALATDGTHQAGYGDLSDGTMHALLWSGSNQATDLGQGFAEGVKATQVVGRASFSGYTYEHAAIWNGSASSLSILNTVDGQTSNQNAPSWYWGETDAVATNLNQQVGYGQYNSMPNRLPEAPITTYTHALVWNGPGSTAVDLNSYLPANYNSQAFSVDDAGDVFGTASAQGASDFYVVEWTPTPEPGAAFLLTAGVAISLLRRRSHRRV